MEQYLALFPLADFLGSQGTAFLASRDHCSRTLIPQFGKGGSVDSFELVGLRRSRTIASRKLDSIYEQVH